MSWAVGWDGRHQRDIGYGVPAICDRPRCGAAIDRGLSYVCGGEPFGGEHGCGLYFCGEHLAVTARRPQRCPRCIARHAPYKPTPETREWLEWKLADESWEQWRAENPALVAEARSALLAVAG